MFDSLVFERHEFQRSTVGMTEEAGPYSRIVSAGTDILPQKGQRLGNGLIDICTEREMNASPKVESEMNGRGQPCRLFGKRRKNIDGYAGDAEKSRQQRDAAAPAQGTHKKTSQNGRAETGLAAAGAAQVRKPEIRRSERREGRENTSE